MAHAPEKRTQLRSLYVHRRLDLQSAADQLGVGYNTARRWKADAASEGDDWEKARSAAALAGGQIEQLNATVLEDYLLLHGATMEELKNATDMSPLAKAEAMSRLADAFNKVMAASSKAGPKLNRLAVATDVIQKLAGFVRAHHPDAAPALAEVLEPFAAALARIYGSK